ncbi:MAG: glycosyltransferase [Planctomycetota bacterium]|jgi:glycosyltransferase involved in cell wall biosynthesis
MSQIHVCHIIEGCVGGTATQIQQAASFLPGKNVKLSFIINPHRSMDLFELLGRDYNEKYNVYSVSMKRAVSPISDIISLLRVKRILRELKPDIVHTHCSKAGVLGRLAARFNDIPSLHTPHVFSMEWSGDGFKYWFYSVIERFMAGISKAVIVLNSEQENLCREVLHLSDDSIFNLVNGVDLKIYYPPDESEVAKAKELFGFKSKDTVIGMAARLEKQKGVDQFLAAMRLVKKDFPRVKALIAGTGTLHGRLEKLCKKYHLEDNLTFLGNCDDMVSFYHSLDLFVLTSLWEGMPYAVLEAQACALPVVAGSCSGTLPLIEPGVTGKLVQVSNVDSMAGAICSYLNDKNLRITSGQKALGAVRENNNVICWAENLYEIYKKIYNG